MPPDDWGQIYDDAGAQYGVDPNLLRSLVSVESGGNPNAVSPVGARGLTQLMPQTAASLHVDDPTDPTQAIPAAARLLRENFDRYQDPQLALAAYHGGTDTANWGPKTMDYVQKVQNAYHGYQSGDADDQQPDQAPAPAVSSVTDKVDAARKAGYSDQEIADYLHKSPSFGPKFDAARKAGYSDSDIYQHFGLNIGAAAAPAATPQAVPTTDADVGNIAGADTGAAAAADAASAVTAAPTVPTPTPAVQPAAVQPAALPANAPPDATAAGAAIGAAGGADASLDPNAVEGGLGPWLTRAGKGAGREILQTPGAVLKGVATMPDPSVYADERAGMDAPDPADQMEALAHPGPSATESPVYKTGVALQKAGENVIPMTPAEQASVAGQVGTGAGGLVTALASSVVGPAGPAYTFGLQGAGEELEKAHAAGATPQQEQTAAQQSFGMNAAAGVLDVEAALRPIARSAPGLMDWAATRLQQAIRSGVVFTGIGEAQQWLGAQIDQNFDPKAHYDFDPKRLASELITGAGAGAVRPAHPQEAAEPPAVQPEQAAAAPPGPGDGDGIIIDNPPQPPPTGPRPLMAGPRPGSEPIDVTPAPGEPLTAGPRPGTEPKSSQDIIDYAKQNLPGLMPEAEGETVKPEEVAQKLDITPTEAAPIAADHNMGVKQAQAIDEAAKQVNPDPTPAQQEAGNYKMADVSVQGIPVTIETPKGVDRTGVNPDGTPWSVPAPAHYGYIRGTEGADGDHVDTYVGPAPNSKLAYVVDQIDPATGQFDEHKAVLGARSPGEAAQIYDAGFSDGSGPARRAAITQMPIKQFKDWIKNGDTKVPVSPNVSPTGPAEGAVQGAPDAGGSQDAGGSPTAVAEPSAQPGADNAQQAPVADAEATTGENPVVAPVASGPRRPPDLIEFLAHNGGLKDFQGELKHLDAHKRFVPGQGMLVRKGGKGVSMDYAREAALEAGYPVGDTVGSFLDALETNLRGTHVFKQPDTGQAADWQMHRDQARFGTPGEDNRDDDELYQHAHNLGVDLNGDETPAEVLNLVHEREAMMADPDAFEPLADHIEDDMDARFGRDLPAVIDEIPWGDEDSHATAKAHQEQATARGPPQAGGEPVGAEGAAGDREGLRDDAGTGGEPAVSRTPTHEQTEQGSQFVVPGAERSARQAAQSREDEGHGRIKPKGAQKDLDEGLFGGLAPADLFAPHEEPAPLPAKTGPQMAFAETTHTKTGAPLFVAKLDGERLPSEEYKALLAEAKKLGGYYSSFRGKGAIPGFQFKDRAKAEQFIREQGGEATGSQEKPPEATPSQPEPSPESEKPPEYGADNKIFTKGAAERAREILRAKLGQLNSGFDPEIGLAGLTLAGYHIEAGARKFADYSHAMLGDLGEAVRPYLRGWYENVRHHPGMDTEGMSTPAEMDSLQEGTKAPTLDKTEAQNGIQGSVRPSDGGASPADDAAATAGRTAGQAPAGQERGSAPVPRAASGEGTEGADRTAEEPRSINAGPADGAGHDGRVPDTGGSTESGAAERPAAERPDATVQGTNYKIEPGALEETRGPKTKARDNLAAIELAKRIVSTDRLATKEEQAVLAKYVGWGGLSGAFPDSTGKHRAGFEEIGNHLSRILTPEEHEAAATSTQYAHYTSEPVVRAMWDAVRDMGFDGGNVFEPGLGIGHFIGLMPDDIAAKTRYEGIERDPISAQIAKLLYPESGVRQADYIKTPMPENSFDLVIGNPPFADTVIQADPKYKARGLMLHDYFFAKSLDSVRPGGLLGFITSAGTMNKIDDKARRFLAERAEFVGGVRLPGDAFSKNAGTSVTTDMLFFKRRPEGRVQLEDEHVPIWTHTVEKTLANDKGEMIRGNVSRYFADNPEQVLGKEGWTGGQYQNRYGVEQHPGTDLPTDLKLALSRLPKDVMTPPLTPEDRAKIDFDSGQKKDGSYYFAPDGRLMQFSDGAGREVGKRGAGIAGGMTTGDRDRITHLVPIRDALRDVFRADLAEDLEGGAKARKDLNNHYDQFVKKFGPINKAEFQYRRPTASQQEEARLTAREEAFDAGNSWEDGDFDPSPLLEAKASLTEIGKARQRARDAAETAGRTFDEGTFDPSAMPDNIIEKRPNIAPFMADPESYRIRSIEDYNDSTGEATKKAIFKENVLKREQEPEIKSANDGVLWSMNKLGRLDLNEIARKLDVDRASVIEDLGDSIFKAPGTETYQTADEYLSGDIISKIEVARAAMDQDPAMRRNLTALQGAMPAPLSPSEISVTIGMPWVPRETYQEFVQSHLRLGNPVVKHSAITGRWVVDTNRVSYGQDRSGFPQWSVAKRDAYELLSDALNRTPPKIYDTVKGPDGSKKQVFNAVDTQGAQDKVEAIKQAFKDWVDSDPARSDGLAKIYNDNLNRTVLRKFDGGYLTTPGVAADWKWRPHQTRVVARIIQSGNTYMAHAVGAGKTSAMIGAGMEMRRLGLVNKPMYAVPNHMLGQFTREFYEQYPTARISVADERNFHTDRRKQFMANVAQDDLDAVIITHSSLGKIPISEDFQNDLIQEELEKLDQSLKELNSGDDRITIKNLKNMKEKLEQKLSAKGSNKQDQTNTFEEMGVDFLFTDEAHLFRKLSFATQQTGLKGITAKGSDMAWDLYTKMRYLDSRKPGRSAVLASGTPITNTMGELFSLSRYMQRQALEKRGLSHFDSWAQTFGDTAVKLEAMPDGSYKPVTRFSKFVNLPELYKMVGEVMDIVTPNELEKYVVRPQLAGGGRQLHVAPFTENLATYQGELAARMKAIADRTGPPQKGDDIILSVINDGRHSAIDPRFVMDTVNDPDSKLNIMIRNAADIWRQTKSTQFYDPRDGYKTPLAKGPAAQMIFANLGVNGRGPMGFSTYAWIKSALLREGVPADEIAFIGDYKDHVARQALFRDVNNGKKRILVGSSQKMGTGVNAQKRLVALHNLDPLWFPADDEQRVGRILRQGNTNPEIQVHDYTTQDTYDQTMWGMMGRKGRFIEQFFRGDPNLRDMEDLGEASAFEQAAAMSTSDPRIMQLTDLKQELDKAERRANAHERDQYSLRQRLGDAVSNAQYAQEGIEKVRQDIEQRTDVGGDKFKINIDGKNYAKRKDAAKAMEVAINTAMAEMGKGATRDIGNFAGFDMILRKNPYDSSPELTMVGKSGREIAVRADVEKGGDGAIQSAEYKLRNLETELDNKNHYLDEAERSAESIRPLLGKQFTGGDKIAEMQQQVRELEDALKPKEEDKTAPVPAAAQPAAATAEAEPTETEIYPGVFATRSEAFDEKAGALQAAAKGILARIAPGTQVGGFERLRMGNTELHGAYMNEPDGLAHAVAWSLAAGDVEGTIRHEAIHYLRRAGLFTPDEWRVLADAAYHDGWMAEHDVDTRPGWEHLSDDEKTEEAVAEEFAQWKRDGGWLGKLPAPIRAIFNKISNFHRQLADAARHILGREATPDDVFSRVERGEVGRRAPADDIEPSTEVAAQPATESEAEPTEEAKTKSLTDKLAAPIKKLLATGPAQKVLNGHTMNAARDALGEFSRDVMMKTDPLGLGSDTAKAVAKDFANEERRISYHLTEFDKLIKGKYDPDERANMGRALDEQSVMDQQLQAPAIERIQNARDALRNDPDIDAKDRAVALAKLTREYNATRKQTAPLMGDRGLGRLPEDQRALAETLNGMSQRAWKGMQDAGIVDGAALPHYMPRYFVNIIDDRGTVAPAARGDSASRLDPIGMNLRTNGPGRRGYLTPEESEAAARTALGKNANLVQDIRALLVSLQRSQRAIAGKELIKAVKDVGDKSGAETVSDEPKDGFFTIDHPAFTEIKPSYREDEDGNMVPRLDENGKPILTKKPIYVSREFEGPLRSVLNKPSGALYNALMQVKAMSVGLIMMSPMTHNMVIYGKAFPLMPGKMITLGLYRDGNKVRKDPQMMDKFIGAGMVPINGGWMQDILGVAREAGAPPGRSIIARGLGNAVGLVGGEKANMKVRTAIDAAGHFWHGTLLWDRIADLQAGIAANMREELLAKGLSDGAATTVAAHFANRFAGAMPKEALSDIARKVANLTMFSRSFTLGNLGIIKDVMTGLPSEVQAQLKRDEGKIVAAASKSIARRTAIGTFIADLALFYGMNAALQLGIQGIRQWLGDKNEHPLDELGKIGTDMAHGFMRRWGELAARRNEHPLDWIDPRNALTIPGELSPLHDNEPGKQDRIFIGLDHNGRGVYVKNPFGKVGEEFKNYLSAPLPMIKSKLSPMVRPLMDTVANADNFGKKVYDAGSGSLTDDLNAVGQIVSHWMTSQVPMTAIQGGYDYATGAPDSGMSVAKSAVPFLTGLSVSQGSRLGPQGAIEKQVYDRHEQAILTMYPQIADMVARGNVEDAEQKLAELGSKPSEIRSMIMKMQNPQMKLGPTGYLGKDFQKYATPEDASKYENVTH